MAPGHLQAKIDPQKPELSQRVIGKTTPAPKLYISRSLEQIGGGRVKEKYAPCTFVSSMARVPNVLPGPLACRLMSGSGALQEQTGTVVAHWQGRSEDGDDAFTRQAVDDGGSRGRPGRRRRARGEAQGRRWHARGESLVRESS
jgi:hypothetical protein